MQIELGRVLWRTRGRTWDYSFVLRPAQPHIENWYGFHTEVFAGTTPGVAPVSVGGTLRTASDDVVSFVATVFQDDTLADLAGRPVVHYLVWFRHSTGEVTDLEVPPNWGSQLVRALGDEWRSLFESNGSSADDVLTDTRWGSRCAALSDSGRVRIPLSRHVIEKKKDRRTPDAQRAAHRTGSERQQPDLPAAVSQRNSTTDLRVAALDKPEVAPAPGTISIDDAIRQGEAYAIMNPNRGTVRMVDVIFHCWKANRDGGTEVLARLASSFGGATTDHFIQARRHELLRIIARAAPISSRNAQRPPRKGFDALVEALWQHVMATEERELKTEIAAAIGAAVDDQVVHVLAKRILALRNGA